LEGKRRCGWFRIHRWFRRRGVGSGAEEFWGKRKAARGGAR
jgi:hypothetical protein